jgi:hypothetical protein
MIDTVDTAFSVSPTENVRCLIPTDGGHLLVTDVRIATSHGHRVTMDLPIVEIRRIQLDIERRRPATFVIVPDQPSTEPQVLPIPAAFFEAIAEASAHIGRVLDAIDRPHKNRTGAEPWDGRASAS